MTVDALAGLSSPGKESRRRLPVLPVRELLEEQQTLTLVARFAREHDAHEAVGSSRLYRDLVPLERPKPGQNYAFEVDLDACTGCKACVTACHTLNGLDDDEIWRTVGVLHGGTPHAPALQTVTTSCHHCLEPACLAGCPVQAYQKDPVTGIVKHLDDQCFGCQYCILMCPYDAPKFNEKRGIVRKCDMCSDRLAHDEAPACVAGCPNGAIAIRVVEQANIVESSDARGFLPGAPDPQHTIPTTAYKSKKPMPSNMLPVDFYAAAPEKGHLPLVFMLTLTQLSAGACAVGFALDWLSGRPSGNAFAQAAFVGVWAVVALLSSVFHLGRPHLFFRAVLGLKTSWLSREVLFFGAFTKLALLYAFAVGAPFLPEFPGKSAILALAPYARCGAALCGVGGVLCSVMVYVATRRPQWSGSQTGVKFFGSTLVLGAAAVLSVKSVTEAREVELDQVSLALLGLVFAASAIKLGFEGSVLGHANDKQRSVEKRMASVMLGDLRRATALRFALSITGGMGLPIALVSGMLDACYLGEASASLLFLVIAGEIAERYLFFRAAPASRMPGALR